MENLTTSESYLEKFCCGEENADASAHKKEAEWMYIQCCVTRKDCPSNGWVHRRCAQLPEITKDWGGSEDDKWESLEGVYCKQCAEAMAEEKRAQQSGDDEMEDSF
jgi:hypothetical protein